MEETQIPDRKNGRRAKEIPQNPAQEHKEVIKALLKTFTHFFGDIARRLGKLPDPRKPQRPEDIDYSVASLVFTGVLMFACHLGARRRIRCLLHTVSLGQTYKRLFGVDDVPHGDTMNNLLVDLEVDAVQEIVSSMTETLIDKKVLYPHRLFDQYYVVAVDATGMLTYDHKHCEYCLTKKHGDVTRYYHHVLEAKIVTPTGMAFSLMSEFIENPEDDPTRSLAQRKQDSELKAFYRLAERLHERFPKLPLLLTFDGLYAVGPVFRICERNHWKFVIGLSDDQLSSVNEEFEALCKINPENSLTSPPSEKNAIRQEFRFANDIDYVDTKKHEHSLSVLECKDIRSVKGGEEKVNKHKWLSNVQLSQGNIVELANQGGRIRWKIENEGFNVQKTGGLKMGHAYSNDENGIKIYYLVLQIAHILLQLLDKGSLLKKSSPEVSVGSVKDLAFRILEALRNTALTDDEYHNLCLTRIQIRFAPP
ncbi:MAG: hypothetical protein L3K26_08380 [Candidatus Hydrogenedentes bacterium]|nr:hypothetical protein [Candidatus Hydrogenedentota bacterium]